MKGTHTYAVTGEAARMISDYPGKFRRCGGLFPGSRYKSSRYKTSVAMRVKMATPSVMIPTAKIQL